MTSSRTRLGSLLASAVDDHRKDLREICFGRLNARLAVEGSRKVLAQAKQEGARTISQLEFVENGGALPTTGDGVHFREQTPAGDASRWDSDGGDDDCDPEEYDYLFGSMKYDRRRKTVCEAPAQSKPNVHDAAALRTTGGKSKAGKSNVKERISVSADAGTHPRAESGSNSNRSSSNTSNASSGARRWRKSSESSRSSHRSSHTRTPSRNDSSTLGTPTPPASHDRSHHLRFLSPSAPAVPRGAVVSLPPIAGATSPTRVPGNEISSSLGAVKHKRSVWHSSRVRELQETSNSGTQGKGGEYDPLLPEPLVARRHYEAVRAKHQQVSRSHLRKKIERIEKEWPENLEGLDGRILFRRLLVAQELWDWLLKDLERDEVGGILAVVKAQYEQHLEDLLHLTSETKTKLDAVDLESLIKHYNRVFSVGMTSRTDDDSANDGCSAPEQPFTVARLEKAVKELEERTVEVVAEYKRTLEDYQEAVEEKKTLDKVGQIAQQWYGRARGERELREAASGNARILEVNRLQRKILDKMARKDGLLARQKTQLISVKALQDLQLSCRQTNAAADRLEQNVKSMQQANQDMQRQWMKLMKKHGCSDAQLGETLQVMANAR